MKESMLAAQMIGYNSPLEIRKVPVPQPRGENVLVRIAGAGLCHSDIYLIDGKNKIAGEFPFTLGHENAGYVECGGEDATPYVKTGDPVAVFGGWSSRPNRFVRQGQEQLSDRSDWVGIGKPGGFAEYLLVPSFKYLVLLGKLDPIEAAPLTDAGLTSYRAVKKILPRIAPGDHIVVIGAGGLGMYGIHYCKLFTQSRVIVVDIDDTKLQMARNELGADFVINNRKENPKERINEITSGEGAYGIIDFVGSDDTLDLAYQVAAKQSKIVVVGLAGGTLHFDTNHRMQEIEVTTSLWGSISELSDVIEIAKRAPARTIIRRIGFEEINDAFSDIRNGKSTGRTVLVPSL